jgi:hypothetical protein
MKALPFIKLFFSKIKLKKINNKADALRATHHSFIRLAVERRVAEAR